MKQRHAFSSNSVLFLFVLIFSVLLFGCGNSGSPTPPTSPDPIPPTQQPPPPTPQTFPDLVISSGKATPSGNLVAPGTILKFSFQISNLGEAAVPSNQFIMVTGPGNISGGFSGGLQPGETKTATIDFTAHSKGAAYNNMLFTVDQDNIIKESNENNNNSQTFTVKTTF